MVNGSILCTTLPAYLGIDEGFLGATWKVPGGYRYYVILGPHIYYVYFLPGRSCQWQWLKDCKLTTLGGCFEQREGIER